MHVSFNNGGEEQQREQLMSPAMLRRPAQDTNPHATANTNTTQTLTRSGSIRTNSTTSLAALRTEEEQSPLHTLARETRGQTGMHDESRGQGHVDAREELPDEGGGGCSRA